MEHVGEGRREEWGGGGRELNMWEKVGGRKGAGEGVNGTYGRR